MTPRERVIAAIKHEPVDRLPLDITIAKSAYDKLRAYLGDLPEVNEIGSNCNVHPDVDFYTKMGIDLTYVFPGAPSGVKPFVFGGEHFVNEFGLDYKKIELADGTIDYEICNTPMKDFEIEDFDAYNWPDPDDPNIYKNMEEKCRHFREQADIAICSYISGSIFTYPSLMIGIEDFLCLLITDPDYAEHIIEHFTDYYIRVFKNSFEACGKYIDMVRLDCDDFGTQNGLIISKEMFQKMVRPYEEKLARETKKAFMKYTPDGYIMKHSCGDNLELMDVYTDMGIEIINPLQACTAHMTREAVYKKVGQKMTYMGGIDTQQVLPHGTVADVYADVKDAVTKFAGETGTGYIIGPSHHLQGDIPVENIIAFRDAAYMYGTIVNGKPNVF